MPSPLFPIAAGFVQLAAPFLVRRILATCRITVFNRRIETDVIGRRAVIGALWHQTILVPLFRFDRHSFVIMVSRSRDGEIGTRLVHGFGMIAVRGSSSAGGREALREMIDLVRRGHTAALICDGPRGPARIAKIGAIVAARDTGAPVVPVGIAIPDAWHIRSWDRTAIPRPFSRIGIMYGEPIHVPADASIDECERIRVRVESEITALEAKALRELR